MAHPELDQLLNALLPFAEQMLAKNGEFFPFGATMTRNGDIVATAASLGGEHPPSQPLIELMSQAFRQQAEAGELRAAGLCFDARILPPDRTEKTDAICVSLEHESGQCMDVFVPYERGWFGKLKYGAMFAASRERQFFGSSSAG